MSWLQWLRVVAVTVVLVPFVQVATRFWAGRTQVGGRHLRVLESCSLGNDGRLHLVEVAGRVFVLASGSKGIEVIQEVTAPEVLAELRRGEGVRGEASLGAELAAVLPARLVALAQAGLAAFRPRSGGAAPEADGPRAVDVLAGHLARVKRLNSVGDEGLAAEKR